MVTPGTTLGPGGGCCRLSCSFIPNDILSPVAITLSVASSLPSLYPVILNTHSSHFRDAQRPSQSKAIENSQGNIEHW